MNLLHMAQTIREFRRRQSLTLEALAAACGVTKGYLSRLENFRVAPSLATLNKIATALGVPMAAFFQTDYQAPPFVLGALDQGEPVMRDDNTAFGLNYAALAFNKLDRLMEPFLIEYSPADRTRAMNLHDADEFYVVLDGQVDFFVMDMARPHTLREGQTIYLSRNVPHTSTLNKKCRAARALAVYCRPATVADPVG